MKGRENAEARSAQAVLYCRVSTKGQTENFSLATQRKGCEDFCERNDLEVADVFEEGGASAKTTNRPELQKLLAYCAAHRKRIDAVVVYSVSRLARNAEDHLWIRRTLAKLGITLRSVTEGFEDSAAGKFVETIMSAAAELDNNQRAERTEAGMKAALGAGRWTHQAPLGYRKPSGGPFAPCLEADPVASPFIIAAFEEMLRGDRSSNSVLRKVTAMGLRGRGGGPLSPQHFGKILRNPLFCGIMRIAGWDIEERGDFQPLISEETFYAVQAFKPCSTDAVQEHRHASTSIPTFLSADS